MGIERTLSIVKPDAVEKDAIGAILSRFEAAGLKVIATRMRHLSLGEAQGFYAVHSERPFFNDLIAYMTSGPVVVSVLEGEDAIQAHRGILGATNPEQAEPGTIRKDFGESIERNAAHGSDAPETAAVEIAYFFSTTELHAR